MGLSPCGILIPSWQEDRLIRIIFPWNEGLSWPGLETAFAVTRDPAWLFVPFTSEFLLRKMLDKKFFKIPWTLETRICLLLDCVCQWMLSKLSHFCEFQFTPFKSTPSGLACSPPRFGVLRVHFNHTLNLPLLLLQVLLYTKKKGKKPQTKLKALAWAANFPSSVKITRVALE